MHHKNIITMHDHLILISKENMIGSEIANLIYTEVKVRASDHDSRYKQCEVEKYEHLVERELTSKEIYNFIDNRHLYTKVKENEYGTIYQYGKDFKKTYWERFPKVEETPKKVFVDKKNPERTHKVCSKCKTNLPLSEFYVSNKTIYSACKKCKKKRYNYKKKSVSLQKSI